MAADDDRFLYTGDQGGYGGREATIVEVGAGEKLVDLAAISILEQAGWLHDAPP